MRTLRLGIEYRNWRTTTASYVVEHANRRARRGRNPSMSYRGERNPRKALALAVFDLAKQKQEIERALEPKDIWDWTRLAMREANSKGCPVSLTFGGATVVVPPNANQVLLVDQLRAQASYRRRTEW